MELDGRGGHGHAQRDDHLQLAQREEYELQVSCSRFAEKIRMQRQAPPPPVPPSPTSNLQSDSARPAHVQLNETRLAGPNAAN